MKISLQCFFVIKDEGPEGSPTLTFKGHGNREKIYKIPGCNRFYTFTRLRGFI